MRYTFPHYAPKLKIVQPDYSKWHAVEIGMSREDVIELLGPPLSDSYRGGKPRADDPYYSYGYLQMPMLPHPRTYGFLIGFDELGRVFAKIDPFDGRFSKDGSPTVPQIIIPPNGVEFDHYPRIVDMRWYPSSGAYPMTYTVELGFGDPFGSDRFQDEEIESDLPFPFFMASFVGAVSGRFRVKATNEIGTSDWSEFRYFQFTV